MFLRAGFEAKASGCWSLCVGRELLPWVTLDCLEVRVMNESWGIGILRIGRRQSEELK